MKHIRRPKAPARFQRFILWTVLTLAWAGEVLAGAMKRFRAGRKLEANVAAMLPLLTYFVSGILIAEAAMQCVGRLRFCDRFTSRKHQMRAYLGFAIRRLLRGRTVAETIARLAHVLRHRAALVARIARRIQRGLTQTHIAPVREWLVPALPMRAPICAAADT